MHDLAILTEASGGKGGGRLLVIVALLVVVVVLAAGWISYATRVRAGRVKKP